MDNLFIILTEIIMGLTNTQTNLHRNENKNITTVWTLNVVNYEDSGSKILKLTDFFVSLMFSIYV